MPHDRTITARYMYTQAYPTLTTGPSIDGPLRETLVNLNTVEWITTRQATSASGQDVPYTHIQFASGRILAVVEPVQRFGDALFSVDEEENDG